MSKKNPSRAERFEDAKNKCAEVLEDMNTLKDELQSWLDNMPENLQSSQKADDLQTAIDELDTITSNLEDVTNSDVTFPTMMG